VKKRERTTKKEREREKGSVTQFICIFRTKSFSFLGSFVEGRGGVHSISQQKSFFATFLSFHLRDFIDEFFAIFFD